MSKPTHAWDQERDDLAPDLPDSWSYRRVAAHATAGLVASYATSEAGIRRVLADLDGPTVYEETVGALGYDPLDTP